MRISRHDLFCLKIQDFSQMHKRLCKMLCDILSCETNRFVSIFECSSDAAVKMIKAHDDLKQRWKSAVQWLGDELERVCFQSRTFCHLSFFIHGYFDKHLLDSRIMLFLWGWGGVGWEKYNGSATLAKRK